MKKLVKVVLALVVVAVAGLLFFRSVKESTAEPYTVHAGQLNGWTLGIGDGADPTSPLLMLYGPPAFVDQISKQIFKRVMESLSSPAGAVVPLLLRGEFDRSFASRMTPAQILAIARKVGLGSGPVTPRCLAHRHTSDTGGARQVYFVLFDMPGFAQFRRELATVSGNATFQPDVLSPAAVVGMVQSPVEYWMPLSADPARDCEAPVVASSGS
jgi:hypothetical protein